MLRPRIINAYKKLETEKRQTDGYYMLLLGYGKSLFQDFESHLPIVVGLHEDEVQITLKQYNEKLSTYQSSPGIYTIEDTSQAVYTMGDHERTLQIEYDDDDDSVKTELILTRFGRTFGMLRIDKKMFTHTLLKFEPYWDYKPTNAIHADSHYVYTSEKILNLSAIEKIPLKYDCNDGSVQNGVRRLILFSFILDKPSGCKVFYEPETIHYEKLNKSVLNTLTFI